MPEYTKEVQNLMQEANAFCIPPKPLILTNKVKNNSLLKNKCLDTLQKNVESLGRNKKKEDCVVNLFIAPHQINSKLADGLFQDIKNDLQDIWKITYKTEQVTDQYHGYRLNVHVNV
jgi:hypothetical protein